MSPIPSRDELRKYFAGSAELPPPPDLVGEARQARLDQRRRARRRREIATWAWRAFSVVAWAWTAFHTLHH